MVDLAAFGGLAARLACARRWLAVSPFKASGLAGAAFFAVAMLDPLRRGAIRRETADHVSPRG